MPADWFIQIKTLRKSGFITGYSYITVIYIGITCKNMQMFHVSLIDHDTDLSV